MRQELRFTGTPCQVTISKRAGKYFASILVDTQDYDTKHPERESVGVDFGIKDLATCSDGQIFAANQKSKHSLKRLAKKQRPLSRKTKGSKGSSTVEYTSAPSFPRKKEAVAKGEKMRNKL